MYKLSGHSLTKGAWFEPESQALILTERNSTSTITLGPDDPEIGLDDWLWDETPAGDVIVWRVKSIGQSYNTETRNIDLEHVIQTLDDITLFENSGEGDEETEPADMPAYNAVQHLLGKQVVWTLGDFQYSVANPYDFQKETLLDALENITETLDDAVWEYDLSQYPFVLHIRQRNTAVTCEMRGGRNISTLKRTISRNGMYTRFYPVGQNNLRLPGEYISMNEGVYGRIDKTETDNSKTTIEGLTAWATGRMRKHCEPEVSIQIGGLELSAETGESLDRLRLNRVCRCPLPEFGTTIEEKITKLQWRDAKKEPDNVQVTLCNNTQDVATIVRREVRRGSGGSGGAGQAKQNYLFEVNGEHLLYEVFDECGHFHGVLRMTSESLRVAFDNMLECTRSEFLLTSESLRIRFENEIESTRSQFEMTSESLRIHFENEITGAHSEIVQTAESIRLEVSNSLSGMSSQIVQTANEIRSEVRNSLSNFYTEIMQTASGVVIRTGDNTRTFHQPTAPQGTQQEPLVDGDLWFNGVGQFTWGDAHGDDEDPRSWLEDMEYNWGQLKTAEISRYDGNAGEWVKIINEEALLQDTRFEATKNRISMIAGQVNVTDGKVESYRSEFQVEAEGIRSTIAEQVNGLSSSISQTAKGLRLEIQDSRTHVESTIEATATALTSDYVDRITGVESHIVQTATEVRSEVNNTRSELRSSIAQEANRISLVVEGYGSNAHIKPAQIVAAINGGSSSILISADHIDLDGYVTSSMLASAFSSIDQATVRILTNGYQAYMNGTTHLNGAVYFGTDAVSWKSKTIRTVSVSARHDFLYGSQSSISGSSLGYLVSSYSDETIYYLGK